uniref:Probable protein phosphatase 2C 43 isoform X1 n=1 Tax=Cicer arietinum TaxID=3827 RepID=A0A3Q7XW11_CICAR|nr:probable protein phosphatase 2C 43 isoform X1 [Cicer arietinum]XP_027188217.1 probable protein phosphatase 2C 43 isoform X1 [Cicer arietinum]
MAAVHANGDMEDHSQLEVGHNELFVGIYDGHRGNIASEFISNNLFHDLLRYIEENDKNISEDILRTVVAETEEKFMLEVEEGYQQQPELGIVGSSCLICVIWKGTLYIANLGDSRAVMGSVGGPLNRFRVQQLVRDHNARNEDIRLELVNLHPDDPNIVTYNFDAWRVKGISEVSRGIGHAYWKREAFTLNSSFQVPESERVPSPFNQPLLSAEPEIYSRVLNDNDKFIIFGSGGLWKLLTNEQAAKIVKNNPREYGEFLLQGIASRVVKIALEIAAGRRNKSYSELRKIPKGYGVSKRPSISDEGTRREYHDDITVIVVFLDKKPIWNPNDIPLEGRIVSCRAFSKLELSDFRSLRVTHQAFGIYL